MNQIEQQSMMTQEQHSEGAIERREGRGYFGGEDNKRETKHSKAEELKDFWCRCCVHLGSNLLRSFLLVSFVGLLLCFLIIVSSLAILTLVARNGFDVGQTKKEDIRMPLLGACI